MKPAPIDANTAEKLKQPFRIQMVIAEAVVLVATLQLALRHEKFKKTPSAKTMEKLARAIQASISQQIPSMTFLLEAGWKEEFDR